MAGLLLSRPVRGLHGPAVERVFGPAAYPAFACDITLPTNESIQSYEVRGTDRLHRSILSDTSPWQEDDQGGSGQEETKVLWKRRVKKAGEERERAEARDDVHILFLG